MRANTSKRKAMSYGRMREKERGLEAEVNALLNRAGDADAQADTHFGELLRGDELPEELRRREDRLAAIRAAKARLEVAQRGPSMRAGAVPNEGTTPRAEGRTSAPTGRWIAATELTSNASDQGALVGLKSRTCSTRSPRRCLPVPDTTTSRTSRSLRRGISTGTWCRSAKARGR